MNSFLVTLAHYSDPRYHNLEVVSLTLIGSILPFAPNSYICTSEPYGSGSPY